MSVDRRIDADVAIVGAGPAGLAAAIAAAGQGLAAVVFDEGTQPGGRLPGQLHQGDGGRWRSGRDDAERLATAAHAAGVRIVTGTTVWGLEPAWDLFLNGDDGGPRSCGARAVVLASGATEVPAPLPGWTLPGVMTPGGLQTMVNVHGVVPGRRALVAGLGPLGLEVAQVLGALGVDVVGVHAAWSDGLGATPTPGRSLHELAHTVGRAAPTRLARWGSAVARRRALSSLAARLAPRRVAGVELRLDRVVLELRGGDRVESALIAPLSGDGTPRRDAAREVAVDMVCLGAGLRPLVELTGSAGVGLIDVPGLSGAVPLHGDRQQTVAPGLYVAGGATGVEGAGVCERQGTVAGLAAAAYLRAPGATEAAVAAARADLVAARRAAPVRFDPHVIEGRREMQRRWEEACPTTT